MNKVRNKSDIYIVRLMSAVLELKPYTPELYSVKNAPADGDCFYHAFVEQARTLNPKTPKTSKALREALLAVPYLNKTAKDRVKSNDWAQDEEIQASAQLADVCVFVWSTSQKLWFYYYPTEDNADWSIDQCESTVYLINKGDPMEESLALRELHSANPTSGYHFDGLKPSVDFESLLLSTDRDESSDEEGETSSEEDEDEEIELLDDEIIDLLQDDDEEEEEEEETLDEDLRKRYEEMPPVEKFKFVKKRLRDYDGEKNFAKKYAKQRELLLFRGDMNLNRLEETPEHALVLDRSPYGKESFALTNNQRFLTKLISPDTENRAVLLFHGVGVGKTCSAVQIATNFSSFYTNKALVILPSSLEGNFRKELFNVDKLDFERRRYESCYGARYLERIPGWYNMSPVQLTKEVNGMINEQFEFFGFIRVVNMIMKIHIEANKNNSTKKDAENEVATRIQNVFSNRVIVIDEVHNIRMGSDNKNEDKTKKQFPLAMKKLIKHAKGIRLVLLSATPMFNDVEEINWLMEIMFKCDKVPYDYQPVEFNTKNQLTSESKNTLQYFARNYVSFMRGQDPNTFPDRLENEGDNVLRKHPRTDISGLREIEPITSFQLTLSTLAGAQRKAYTELIANNSYGKNIKKLEQISNILYPFEDDFKYGKDGFSNFFEQSMTSKKQAVLKYREGVPKFTEKFLSKHACKLHTILQHIQKAEGIVMVFSFYIYSGLLPLALALEHAGYTKYGGSLLKEGAPKTSKGSYIILTAKEEYSPDNNKQIRELNSPENKDGDKIKIVLVGQVGSEGVDLQCVREVHIMEPWYHMNKIEQIVGRAVRFKSHERLPPEKRNATIYRHVALFDKRDTETLDYKNYRISEQKMKRIEQVEEILSKYALDCPLNTKENNRTRSNNGKIVDSQGKTRDESSLAERSKTVCARKIASKRDVSRLSSIVAADLVALAKQVIEYIEENNAIYIGLEDRGEVPSLLSVPAFQGRNTLMDGAMRWIVRTRTPITVYNMRGRLLELQGAYLFQPERIHDVKVTINDRRTPPDQRVRNFVLSIPDVASASKAEATLSYEEVIRAIRIEIQRYKGMVEHVLPTSTKVDESVLVDMVIDRVTEEQLGALVSNLEQIKNTPIHQSLRDAGIFLTKHPNLYFDYHQGFFRRLNGEKANLAENDRAMADMRREKHKTLGFFSKSKGRLEFKMTNPSKDNKQVGTNCVATSTIKKDHLVTFIGTHLPTEGLEQTYGKLGKPVLCAIYEYALRATNSKERHFLRPAEFQVLVEKN